MGRGLSPPARWVLLLGPVGYQGIMQGCILFAPIMPDAVDSLHRLASFLCRPGLDHRDGGGFVIGHCLLTDYIILDIDYIVKRENTLF